MIDQKIISLICCPNCQQELAAKQSHLICPNCQQKYPIVNSRLIVFPETVTSQNKLSLAKWNNFYQEKVYSPEDERNYLDLHRNLIKNLDHLKKIDQAAFLELGCGPMFLGQYLAPRCRLVVGVDFSFKVLKLAQKMFQKKGIDNYLLIQADLSKIPIKKDVVDFIYGGGVIEHFQETKTILVQIYRVLKKRGVVFNSVPVFNLGTIYRQIWGNIPDLPILRSLAEFFHLKLLGGRHLRFGYELSFLPKRLIKLHRQAGFKKVIIDKLDIESSFEYLPNRLKPLALKLTKYKLFWPMIKVVAYK
ncbi:MAG: methyltransferase domain-containing protein [Candidatus Shapirobacteria bacterium]|nr:methyltransferase domain-containing protein [Candidatus Shapirobacteria bacterium]